MNYQNQMLSVLTSRSDLARSAWDRGVARYACELLRSICDRCFEFEALSAKDFERLALNGAENWREYSLGGCSLIYDEDIARRLCNTTELKHTKNGRLYPNKRETWLDVQARALYQAFSLLVMVRKVCMLEYRRVYVTASGLFVLPGAGSQKIKRCVACYERELTPNEREAFQARNDREAQRVKDLTK